MNMAYMPKCYDLEDCLAPEHEDIHKKELPEAQVSSCY